MRFSRFHFSWGGWRWQGFKHRLLEWLSIAALAVLVIVPLGMLAWLVFFTDTFSVLNVTVVDAREHTSAAVRTIAQELGGQNILFAQTPRLEARILTEVPQIRNVHIARKLPSTLKIIVQEKTPALLLLSGGKYFAVDDAGIAYEAVSLDTLPGTVLPTIKNTDAAGGVTLGTPVVEAEFVEFVQEAEKALPDIVQAQVAETRIPSLAAREVHFLLDNNWLIRFDVTRSLASQLDVLRRLLEGSIPAEKLPLIEYIDLRIANRVYYKLK